MVKLSKVPFETRLNFSIHHQAFLASLIIASQRCNQTSRRQEITGSAPTATAAVAWSMGYLTRHLGSKNVQHVVRHARCVRSQTTSHVFATRNPSLVKLDDLTNYISFGASPRASINLSLAAKANAFFNNRDYVIPDDIKEIAYDVLNHRIILNYEAEAEGITSQEIIKKILDRVEINS